MKKLSIMLGALALVTLGVFSCQKTIDQNDDRGEINALSTDPNCTGSPYSITLLKSNYRVEGGYLWEWRIQNPRPGNGRNGTVQALSHFSLIFPICEPPVEIVRAYYQKDGGIQTNVTNLMPSIDNSLTGCNATEISIKYDLDGNGTFTLVVKDKYSVGPMSGYYKSGNTTGCGQVCFQGMICLQENPDPSCSYSQGFWFRKPLSFENQWPSGSVTVGGHTYTTAEGRAVWVQNAPEPVRRAFTQAATLKLSIAALFLTDDSEVSAWLDEIDAILSKLDKLDNGNIATESAKLTEDELNTLNSLAGAIGDWVDENHCGDPASGD